MQHRSSIAIATLGAVGAILNILAFHSAILGVPSVIILIVASGWLLGQLALPSTHVILATIIGFISTLAWICFAGSICFYVANLGLMASVGIYLSIPIALFVYAHFEPQERTSHRDQSATSQGTLPRWISIILTAVMVITASLAIRTLLQAATTESIRSPWDVVPASFLVLFTITGAGFVIFALHQSRVTLFAAIACSILAFSVTLFVYPAGYGFDPFIHQATERYIVDHHTITPKPFTYVGQYSLVVVLARGTALPVAWIDRALLPLLLGFGLPAVSMIAFAPTLLATIMPLTIPISTFAGTTPQGLANILTLIVLLLVYGCRKNLKKVMPLIAILTAAVVTIHIIAAVPLIAFLALVIIFWKKKNTSPQTYAPNFGDTSIRLQRYVSVIQTMCIALIVAGSSVALPVLFAIYGKIGGYGNIIRSDAIVRIPSVLLGTFGATGTISNRFSMVVDFAYLVQGNIAIVLLLTAGIGTILELRKRNTQSLPYLLVASIAFANAVFLIAAINFSFLPSYEQSGYALRLFDLAKLCLLPPAAMTIARGISYISKQHTPLLRLATVSFLTAILTANVYLMYPHHDAYITEHGWSVGFADFDAVRLINQDANVPFIVLANQSVSAAALHEFGFKSYLPFRTDNRETTTSFYYPIPTGGPLYSYFLKMTYDGTSRTTMQEAMERAGVTRSYFVVNKYWTSAHILMDRAQAISDASWSVDDGRVMVFRFDAVKSQSQK